MNWLNYYRAFRLVRQSRFAEAISLDKKGSYVNSSWAYYRLGMYRSAQQVTTKSTDFNTLFAKSVSLVNIGNRSEAEVYLTKIKKKYKSQASLLIQPLATYFPEYALDLAHQYNKRDSGLYIGLCAQIEGRFAAQQQLKCLKIEAKQPDFKLLHANFCIEDNLEKLAVLNTYLAEFGLSPVSLKHTAKALSVYNLDAHIPHQKSKAAPLVSIIIPAYNIADRIASCVQSLLAQDYPYLEIIVVDDASTDGTATVIQQLSQMYANVHYVQLPVNMGPFVAKTVGTYMAKGEFITTQDSDDWAHPQRISKQVLPLLKDKNLVATTCQWVRLGDCGHFYARQLYPYTRLNPSSPMFRKTAVQQKIGLWDLARLAGDTEFLTRLKLVFGHKRVLSLKIPLVIGAHRENSLMTSDSTGHKEDRVSAIRLDYWEAWGHWHINQLRHGTTPKIPQIAQYQPQFAIPSVMLNSEEKLEVIKQFILSNF